MTEEKEEKKGFVIKDRRMFSEEGKSATEEVPATEPEIGTEKETDATGKGAPTRESETVQMPEINFSTFVFSLNASALVNLGAIEDPVSGQKVKNLPIAKQTIDILGMLEEKTRNNLTTEEASLLENILYDLRLMYVREKKG